MIDGYVFLESNSDSYKYLSLNNSELIKELAKHFKRTYREVENVMKEFLNTIKNTIIYFEFQDNFLTIKLYLKESLVAQLMVDLKQTDKTQPNPTLEDFLKSDNIRSQDIYTEYLYYCFVLTQCALWYLATASRRTKYYRENKAEPYYYEKKEVIQTKKNRVVSTPIYDMNKIRKVKLDNLIKRRKGWTYSHSFQVQGHYRHYSDGKVIFINSYIKGKGKEEMPQVITLNPKELK